MPRYVRARENRDAAILHLSNVVSLIGDFVCDIAMQLNKKSVINELGLAEWTSLPRLDPNGKLSIPLIGSSRRLRVSLKTPSSCLCSTHALHLKRQLAGYHRYTLIYFYNFGNALRLSSSLAA